MRALFRGKYIHIPYTGHYLKRAKGFVCFRYVRQSFEKACRETLISLDI